MSKIYQYNNKVIDLHRPSLEEVSSIFKNELPKYFENVSVSVEESPNLKKEPFNLAGEGLCGQPVVSDIGGVPYLAPLAQTDRPPYSMLELAKLMNFDEKGFLIGAACGPFYKVGINCELMPNISFIKSDDEYNINNQTHCAKIVEDGYKLFKLNTHEFCILGNLFASKGEPGNVLKIKAKKRIGQLNFITTLRKILKDEYGDKPVSLGGVFLIKSGKAKIHIMPSFSETPLQTDEDVENWLRFFEMDSPLVCLSVFHSTDPGMDLRIEHSHCFSQHGQGGHYHYDTTPEEVEYEAYFNVAEKLYRFDAPAVTHNVGRD